MSGTTRPAELLLLSYVGQQVFKNCIFRHKIAEELHRAENTAVLLQFVETANTCLKPNLQPM